MTLSHQDVRNILGILDQAEHLESIDLRFGDIHLQARKPGAMRQELAVVTEATVPQATSTLAKPVPSERAATGLAGAGQVPVETPPGMAVVAAPMLGTFYARPSPDQPPFVTAGATVQAHDTVGLVEVMKMFNTVKAGVAGTVHRIVAESGKTVQAGQALLLIVPVSEE
jgi:acetyl-CoA carboxylase biotin carboxyl carrier protein